MVKRGYGSLINNTSFHKILTYQDMVIASMNNGGGGSTETIPNGVPIL